LAFKLKSSQLLLPIAMLVLLGLMASAVDRPPSPLLHRLKIARDDAQSLKQAWTTVLDEIGIDQASRDQPPPNQQALAEFAKDSDGILTVTPIPGGIQLDIDRVIARRRSRESRKQLRDKLGAWFPSLSERSDERYGLRFYTAGPEGKAQPWDKSQLPYELVVCIHGLDDTGRIWRQTIGEMVKSGHTVCRFDYRNDQAIATSAADFADALFSLGARGVTQVRIVAHSMGGLVSREMLTRPGLYAGDGTGRDGRPAVTQLITVGTPHKGSGLARVSWATEVKDQLVRTCSGEGVLFGSFFDGLGEARNDLLPSSVFLTTLNARAHPKNVRLTCIAGVASPIRSGKIKSTTERLRASLPRSLHSVCTDVEQQLTEVVEGAGDGCVSLESAHPGVADQPVVKANHVTMLLNLNPLSKKLAAAIPVILDRLSQD